MCDVCKWQKASEQCDTIVELIDDEITEEMAEKADDGFFENIREKSVSIQETIDRNQHASEAQKRALNNMERGVRAWTHD